MLNRIRANWKKTLVFCAIYALVSAIVLSVLSVEPGQILRIVIVSTAILAGMINYIGVFQAKE